MDPNLLVREQIDGGQKLIEQLGRDNFPMAAAFWMKTEDEDDRWYLHIVTPMVEDSGPFAAYRQIRAAAQQCQWTDAMEVVDVSSVKALETTHPLSKAAADLMRRYPGPLNTWVRAKWVGDSAASGTFVYGRVPSPTPAAAS